MKRLPLLLPVLLVVVLTFPTKAQKINDLVSKYGSHNGKGYLQPLADAFGANINSGFYHTANISAGFHMSLTVEAMAAFVPNDKKKFTATTEDPFYPTTMTQAPTIFGSVDPVSVSGVGGTAYVFPGGLNAKNFPLAVPQLTVGSVLGTEATLRYVDVKVSSDVGTVKLLGGGVRHSISQYLREFPLDLSVGFFIQKFDVGEIISANATLIGAQASYPVGILTLYGGTGYEKSSMDVSYDSDTDTTKVKFKLDGVNSVRFTLGVALKLAILQIHADYNLGSQSVACAGVGFGL